MHERTIGEPQAVPECADYHFTITNNIVIFSLVCLLKRQQNPAPCLVCCPSVDRLGASLCGVGLRWTFLCINNYSLIRAVAVLVSAYCCKLHWRNGLQTVANVQCGRLRCFIAAYVGSLLKQRWVALTF